MITDSPVIGAESALTIYPHGLVTQGYRRSTVMEQIDGLDDAYRMARQKLTYRNGDVGDPTGRFLFENLKTVQGLRELATLDKPRAETPRTKIQRSRRGLKGIPNRAKRQVMAAAAALEQRWPRNCLSFLTGTLPETEVPVSSEQWARIMKRFLESLSRALIEHSLPPLVLGSTEVQEKRWERTGQVALHCHLVFPGRRPHGHWALSPTELQTLWNRAVSGVLSDNVILSPLSATTNVQQVKKSVTAYLGKYLSKGATVCNAVIEAGLAECLPFHWTTLTRKMRRLTAQMTIKLTGSGVETIASMLRDPNLGLLKWYRDVTITLNDGSLWVAGWCGYLSSRGVKICNKFHSRELPRLL